MRRAMTLAGILTCVLYTGALYLTPLFGNSLSVVVSGSMRPAIQINALTVVHHCHIEDVEVGDIINYWYPPQKRYITHRVVDKEDRFLITRGDANKANDPAPVTDENIFGKIIWIGNFLTPIISWCVINGRLNKYILLGVTVAATMVFWLGLSLLFVCVHAVFRARRRAP